MTEGVLVLGAIAVIWFSVQYGWWRQTVPYKYPRILMYHMVTNHKPRARFNKLRVEPIEFEKQIKWLKENGWSFVFVSQLTQESDVRRVALTFDDGYRDNYLVADQVLKKYAARATLYLTVDRHDVGWSSKKNESHEDSELQLEPKLMDDEVAQMLDSGRWELGSHTLSHANLLDSTLSQKEAEIQGSKSKLEELFRRTVTSFAYPFGYYDQQDVELARSTAYTFALTTEQGISTDFSGENALRLKRVKVSGRGGMYMFKLRMRTGKCRLKD